MFVSTDGGRTWADRSDAGMRYWTKDVVVDPGDPTQSTWYAGVFSGWGGPANDRARRGDLGLRLQDACADLDDHDLPLTLVHGDFHLNNVARVGQRFTLFDWSFAAVSHPLLDLATWLGPGDDPTPALAAYGEPWRRIVSPATMRAAWPAARTVAALVELIKFVDLADTTKGFKGLVEGKYDHLPEAAFYMVGTIEEAVEKGKKLAAEAA